MKNVKTESRMLSRARKRRGRSSVKWSVAGTDGGDVCPMMYAHPFDSSDWCT